MKKIAILSLLLVAGFAVASDGVAKDETPTVATQNASKASEVKPGRFRKGYDFAKGCTWTPAYNTVCHPRINKKKTILAAVVIVTAVAAVLAKKFLGKNAEETEEELEEAAE
ncbi:MAG: hypothetical protein UR26_C0001G0214 [candidate division TM6 bacterium GW2011_GWF2_32_72]|nr:MAG: hypothetical protein UR26_C0001G0214 [candidate division TM6 bacterium GW2011_GWF2_32_72]